MDGPKRAVAFSILFVAGCQTVTSEPPSPAPTPPSVTQVKSVKPPASAPVVATGEPPAPAVDSRASVAEKMAAQQARSIQELLDAKQAADAGIPVVEPGKQSAPPTPAAPPAPARQATNPPPAGTDSAKPAPPADQFRPVPPISNANIALTPEAPAVTPPPAVSDASPAPANVASTPPAPNNPAGDDLTRRAREHTSDLAAQLDEQLQKFAHGDPVPSAEALSGLSSEDRDVLTGVLDGLSNFRSAVQKDNNLLITKKIQPLVNMADRLRSKADLTIANLSLCTRVDGYGMFTPITPLRLVRGVNNRAILYYEVENISPRLDGNNMWSTKMRDDIVLYDAQGGVKFVWQPDAVTDVCRNRRRDFFYARRLDLPTNLDAGNYTLKVTLSDLNASRVCEASLPITIILPGGNGAGVAPAGPAIPR